MAKRSEANLTNDEVALTRRIVSAGPYLVQGETIDLNYNYGTDKARISTIPFKIENLATYATFVRDYDEEIRSISFHAERRTAQAEYLGRQICSRFFDIKVIDEEEWTSHEEYLGSGPAEIEYRKRLFLYQNGMGPNPDEDSELMRNYYEEIDVRSR